MSKMNMIVHDMEGEVASGDTLLNPKFLDGGSLRTYDIVVANPMWSDDRYGPSFYENDPFNRFWAGYPTANSADWGWIQHMFASLNERGRAAVIIDTGAMTRGSDSAGSSKEKEIRKAFVERDVIEAVVLLPENLFYNTPSAGVILVLNKAKPANRRGLIALINASRDFEKGRPKNFIPDDKILRIAQLFHEFKDVSDVATVISIDEVTKNDFNLLPSRYVGLSSIEDVKPLSEALNALAAAERKRTEADNELDAVLRGLGFDGWKNG
jgi:type I restriction enzyme M protein